MRTLLPKLDIGLKTGFSNDIDIFNRVKFGKRLANLIENANDNPVIALDAGWGEGKSTFVKMWMGYLKNERENKLKMIFFDAFQNDYQKDPFLTLASEIYQILPKSDTEKRKEFKNKAISAVKSLSRGAIKIGIKTATGGIIDSTCIDSLNEEYNNQIDKIIKHKFDNAKSDKIALKKFKNSLEDFAKEYGEGKPIVFIIDELDRCKPDFALDLLEQIKHLFSVNGITFILVTNRTQLEESIKNKYGNKIDPINYLHKFINIWITLSRKSSKSEDHGIKFLDYAISNMMQGEESILNKHTINSFKDIIKFYKPSFREIERMLSYYSIVYNMFSKKSLVPNYQYMLAIVCYFKTCNPIIIKKIKNGLEYEKLIKLTNLIKVGKNSDLHYLYYIKKLLQFDISDSNVRQEMIDSKEINYESIRIPEDIFIKIISWLSNIDRT